MRHPTVNTATGFLRTVVSAVLEVHKTTERKMTGDFTFLDDTKQVIAKLFGYEAVMDKNLFDSFKKN